MIEVANAIVGVVRNELEIDERVVGKSEEGSETTFYIG